MSDAQAEGTVQFYVDIRVPVVDMKRWSPDRIQAFFDGITAVRSAITQDEPVGAPAGGSTVPRGHVVVEKSDDGILRMVWARFLDEPVCSREAAEEGANLWRRKFPQNTYTIVPVGEHTVAAPAGGEEDDGESLLVGPELLNFIRGNQNRVDERAIRIYLAGSPVPPTTSTEDDDE